MTTVTLQKLNAAEKTAFVDELGEIYEHAPWVAEAAYAQRPFASLNALHEAMTNAVREASAEQRIALLKGHPELAGKAARAGVMTPDSNAEQGSAGLDHLSEAEYGAFHRLNDAYRKKFGIPFIVCVRRHSKESILHQFERRLQNGAAAETKAALTEVFRIAALRLDQRVEAADKLKVHGRLSTHVLDTHAGHPAGGVTVELLELPNHGPPRVLAKTTTNLDGRTDQPLIGGRPVPIGHYQLRFHMGEYFSKRGTPHADPPFLDVVPVQFAVAEPEGHYHVPLLVTPWSYSTYRGS
ncbi:MAG: 2-oxo-4-hydroxy-4-carboxy-5-ureidoimidazoline decarboxylase [Xanthobacteraceae bacterium]